MKKNASVLITNYNKGKYLNKSINSCLNQNVSLIEVLIFDDCSTDQSRKLLKKIKNKKILTTFNLQKKYKSGPLNQINGIDIIYKKSKGKIIFLLDSDDYFKKDKLKYILDKFKHDKKLNFLQDKPFCSKRKKNLELKKKRHTYSIWPSFYPTSCIAMRRLFFAEFLKLSKKTQFPNLEIDARLSIYAFLKNKFKIIDKNLTIYNFDQNGIMSKYKKFSFGWWKKRNEAFGYMRFLCQKMKIKFIPSFDYYFTKLINYII